MNAEERELLRTSIRQLLTSTSREHLRAALLELGVVEALEDDPRSIVELVFEEQGRAIVASPALDLVLAATLGQPADEPVGVVLPPLVAGRTTGATSAGSTVEMDGIAFTDAPTYVVAVDTGGPTPSLARVAATAVDTTAVQGFDPDLGLQRVRGSVPANVMVDNEDDAWAAALHTARRALGHELVGVAENLLTTARAHVTERHQFGQPIAMFQTVKHRLAEVHALTIAGRKLLELSWQVGGDLPSILAKAQCGQAAVLAAKHAQQVCGGIGFTWEHGLHRSVRRAYVLDSILGPSTALQEEVGRRLVDTHRVPRLGHLEGAAVARAG